MPPADTDGGALLDEELGNQAAGDKLGTHRGPGCPFDAPVEFHDEQPVQDDIGNSPGDFPEHGGFRMAHGTDEVVHARSDSLEYRPAQDNAHVAFGHGECLVAGPEQPQERRHEDFAEGKGKDSHQDEQRKGVVQNDACLDVLLLSETDGKEGVPADPYNHGHGHDEQSDGKTEGDACDAETAYALAHEKTVHNVVEGVDAHADDGGDRKLQHQFRDACGPKGVEALGVEFTHRRANIVKGECYDNACVGHAELYAFTRI